MLKEFQAELVTLYLDLQKIAAGSRELEASTLLDRILELEDKISDSPACTLTDAAIKLHLLKIDLSHDLAPRQRRMLNDALSVLDSDLAKGEVKDPVGPSMFS